MNSHLSIKNKKIPFKKAKVVENYVNMWINMSTEYTHLSHFLANLQNK